MKTYHHNKQLSGWVSTIMASASILALPLAAHANPTGGTVAAGAATIANTSANQLDVNQSTDKAVINWDTFNIAPNQTTNFNQPGAGSATLNRIGDANPSQILGALNANGHLMLINPNGMMFGNTARVNVGSLTATTADMDDDAFMAGSTSFNKAGNAGAGITNNGQITSNNGFTALVAPNVANNGTIRANAGKVALAGGSVFTLDPAGDQLVNFALPEGTVAEGDAATNVAVNQNGSVIANRGTVELTADQADAVVGSVVNMNGLTRARGSNATAGKIVLTGGDVNVNGALDAAGNGANAAGGTIQATARDNLSFTGNATASGNGTANGGSVALQGDTMTLGGTVNTAANGEGQGGTASFHTTQDFTVDDLAGYTIGEAMGTNGTVEVGSDGAIDVESDVDTSAQTNTSSLMLKDGNADGSLETNLNGKLTVGENQNLGGEATLVNVGTEGSVQNGVDISSEDGSTVNVAAGTFNEDVNVNKSNITLNGANAGVAAGDEARGDESVIGSVDVTGDDATVDGFTAQGIAVNGGAGAQIRNNIVGAEDGDDAAAGITFKNTDGGTAQGNLVQGHAIGMKVQNSDNVTLDDNALNAATGVDARNSDGLTVTDNQLSGGEEGATGIWMNASNEANVRRNTLTGYGTGVDARNSGNLQLRNNQVTGATTGITVRNTDNADIGGNTVTGNGIEDGTGIAVRNSDDVLVRNNQVASVERGVDVRNSDDLIMRNNTVYDVDTGVFANNADGMVAINNSLTGQGDETGVGYDIRNSDDVDLSHGGNTTEGFGQAVKNTNSTIIE